MNKKSIFKKLISGVLAASLVFSTPSGILADEDVSAGANITAGENNTEGAAVQAADLAADIEAENTDAETGAADQTADAGTEAADYSADVETEEIREASLPKTLIHTEKAKTGEEVTEEDYRADIVSAARSQRGYQESEKNYVYDENGQKKSYNRYAAWYGEDAYGEPWDAEFDEFVLWYSGIKEAGFDEAELNARIPAAAYNEKNELAVPVDPYDAKLLEQITYDPAKTEELQEKDPAQTAGIPYDDDTVYWTWKLAKDGRYRIPEYEAKAGDIVFLMEEDGTFHTGIVTDRVNELRENTTDVWVDKIIVTAATVGEKRDEVKEYSLETTDKRIYAYAVTVDEDKKEEEKAEAEAEADSKEETEEKEEEKAGTKKKAKSAAEEEVKEEETAKEDETSAEETIETEAPEEEIGEEKIPAEEKNGGQKIYAVIESHYANIAEGTQTLLENLLTAAGITGTDAGDITGVAAESEDDTLTVSFDEGTGKWTVTTAEGFKKGKLVLTTADGEIEIYLLSRGVLTITAGSASKEYDGEELTEESYTVSGLAEGDRVESVTFTVQSDSGETEQRTDAGVSYNMPGGAVITDAEGTDVTSYYDVAYMRGILTVEPKRVTLKANSLKTALNEDDAHTISVDGFTCSAFNKEETISGLTFEGVTASGSGETQGIYEVGFSGVTAGETKDTTGNYVVAETINGLLIIEGEEGKLISKEMTGFNGDLATYRITFNSEGHILHEGKDIVLKDTFSKNQSVIYSTINVECTGQEYSYDYSGYTGTFYVPDGDAVTITYTTRVQGNAGEKADITNTAEYGIMSDGKYISGDSVSLTDKVTITPTGSDIHGQGGVYTIDLYVYPESHMEDGLEGAVFRLLDSNMQPMTYKAGEKAGEPITFTTADGENGSRKGYVTISLNEESDGLSIQKNTVYYLEMITAPYEIRDGEYVYYRKDSTYYSFLITDNPNYTYGGVYSYFNGDVLKVRCYPEAGGVNVTKRFSGNYELTDEQKNAIRFILQKEDLSTSSGWVNVESHTYAEFSYGSLKFRTGAEGGPELADNATYRVIEENALPEELEGVVDEEAAVSVSYQIHAEPVEEETNEFFVNPDDKAFSYNLSFTNTYVDHKLTVVKQDKNTGAFLAGAEFSVFEEGNDGEPVNTYTTDTSGSFSVHKADADEYSTDTLYYAVETKAPEGYILPETPEKVYFYFSENSSAVPQDLPEGETAVDLTTSYNTVTIANNSEKVSVPVTVVWGINGDEAWPDNDEDAVVKRVVAGLYRSVDGDEPEKVTDEEDAPITVTLTKEKNYDNTTFKDLPAAIDGKPVTYSVVEEEVYDAGGNNIISRYANSSSISGTGWYVINNQPAVSVKVKKEWRDLNDGSISDASGKPEVTFDLYRKTTESEQTVFTHDQLADFLADAEKVRTGLKLNADNGWTNTADSLEKTDKQGNAYYYYTLENIPDNQEDSYTVTPASGTELRTLTIKNKQTPVTVVISANDLEKTYGDDDPEYTFETRIMEEGASVSVDGPDGAGKYTVHATDANGVTKNLYFSVARAAGENVGTYDITVAGQDSQEGYRVLFENGTLTVEPAEVTVEAGAEKIYGDTDPSLVTITGLKNDDPESVISFTAVREEGEDAGSYPITLEGETRQGNYTVKYDRSDAVFTINKAPATVTAGSLTRIYGDDDPDYTATVTGLKNDDAPTVIEYDITRAPGEDIGEYAITPAGEAEQGNYTVTYVPGKLTIGRAPLKIAVENAEKTYGDADPEWEVSIEGLAGNDEGGALTVEENEETGVRTYTYALTDGETSRTLFTFTVSREAGENVGSYAVTPAVDEEYTDQGNYTLSEFTPGTLTVNKAELTVTPDHIVKAVGVANDPLLTATVEGWKNGDETSTKTSSIGTGENEGVITWTYTRGQGAEAVTLLTFTLKRDPGEDEGEYAITAEGGSDQSNYTVAYEPGTFGILSVLDVDVTQPLIDYADAAANPSYSYKATLDLTGTGLDEYSKNDFEMVEGVPTCIFTLPDAGSSTMKTLKVPGSAKITVVQTSENTDYTTAVSIDGTPAETTDGAFECSIDHVDTYHEISFTHSRISLPVEARAAVGQTEDGAATLPGRKGAMGIPQGEDAVRSIDGDFADDMHSKIGYELPTDKYYVYDHASLYTEAGEAVEGGTNVSEIKYDRENSKWQYRIGEGEFTDVPDDARIVLFYLPKYVCKIGTEKFYSLKAAVEYAGRNENTATIEMLIPDYSIRTGSDAVTIPEGYNITITTASTEYEGTGTAVISRSLSNTAGHLFTNNGTLAFSNIILDGKDVAARDALILNQTTAKKQSEEDPEPEPATLTIAADAALRNANGNNGGAIFVKNGVAEVYGTLEDNAAQNGGAIYVEKGSLTVNSSNIKGNTAANGGVLYIAGGVVTIETAIGDAEKQNSATNGGAVYMTGGSLKVSGTSSLKNNTATNGGAVYFTGGTMELESGSIVENNTADSGGAIYLTGGTLAAAGSITGNTASSGGAIYQYSGTVNSTGTINNNTASDGGAVYIIGGTFNLTGGSISENHSNANGGAVFGGAGTFNVSAGTMQNNTAAQNGGAIYATNAAVNIKGGSLSGNEAQNGGAVYMNSSTVAISTVEGGVAPTISGNKASVYGGAIYVNLGAVQYTGGTITGNSAVNGAAIFVNSGNGTISAGITGNAASEGGAVGVGSASARLYFKGGAAVSGNTLLNASGDEPERNVYLDKDSDQVINVTEALQEGSAIGVYVPGDLNSAQVVKHGDVGGYFGAYTITTNVETAFKNDRFAELDAKYENNRLYWGAKLTYDFVYKKAFEPTDSSIAGQSYTATGGSGYLQVALDKAYYPHGAENNEYVIYDLINSMNLYNTYSGTMNTRAGNATNGAASVYAYTFANGSQDRFDSGLKFSDFLTAIKWNNVERRWDFVKQNGEPDTTLGNDNRRVVIIYAAPAYLTITNNNEPGHTLSLSSLQVNGKNVTAAPPYGYATARNGATVTTLQPLSADDLVLQSGESVKLLFPGAQGKNYTLNGTFDGAGADTSIPYTINGTSYTNTGTNVNISKGLKNNYDAEEIVFGTPLPICKIVDGGVTHEFSLLKDAVQYMVDHKNSGTEYTVEMLVDYLIPKTDAMDIPSGFQVTFTTSQNEDFKGSNKDQTDEEGNVLPKRAILSRDVGNSGSSSVQCVVAEEDKTANSTLTVTNLIFDGRAIAGTGNGGAISSRYCDVTINNCEFKGYRAVRGGAIFVVRGGTADQDAQKDADGIPVGGLKIYNSHFENCQSSANVDKAGGGAVWTTAKGLVIDNCRFDNGCACTGGSAQGGAVFHNISDDKTHRFKEYDSDSGNAYYEPGYSANTKTILNACVFDNVYALGGAGGAVETDAQDTEITGCRFLNCYTNANGGGGALIAYARDRENPDASWPSSLTISDSEFINSRAESVNTGNWGGGAVRTTTLETVISNTTFNGATTSKNGAAICVTGSNASSLATFEIYGCTFNDCNAAASGGAIYCPVNELTIGDYTPEGEEPVHTRFTNCIAGTHGGGAYHASRAAGSFALLQNTVFDSCVARTGRGGGFFGESYDLTVRGNSALFTNCTAQNDGGGICHNHGWSPSNETTTMKLEGERNGDNAGIIFRDCTAVGYTGGAVRASAKNVSLENVLMEGNTATTEGGGIWMSPAVGNSVIKNCEFTDNHAIGSDSKGGSIYLYNGNNILQFINSKVSDSSAVNGGGIYQYQVKLYILGGSIEGEATANGGGLYVYGNGNNKVYHYSGAISGTAGSNGGGVYYGAGEYHIGNATYEGVDYTGASIGSVSTDSEGNTVYTATAGNDGGGIYQNDGSLNINAGASIVGQAAGNGGGVYSRKTLNQNAGDISGSAANGGGVYKTNQNNYTLSTGTVTGTATGNGGAVYLAATTLNFNGGTIGEKAAEGDDAAVHSTATNGGGLYVAGGTVNVKNGTIAGATATRNGGGLYVAGGTYNFYRGSIVRNTAGENGGGVYHGGGTFKMTTENNATASAIIGGSAENGNTADKGAGLFVADGQKPNFDDWADKKLQITYNHALTEGGGIAVGGPSAVLTFKHTVQIQHNTMGADHIECNVYLDQDSNMVIQSSGLDATAYIGVYASDSQDNIHGQSGMPFGKYSSDGNLDRFYNDRRPFLYGMKGSNNLVIWSEFVCRITDGAGNLLFKTANGTPAVYAAVENVTGGALKDLCSETNNSTPNLYYKDAETGEFKQYQGNEFQVQMLVEEYLSTQIKFASNADGRKVKLTTASAEPDEFGFKYQGDPRKSATIKRGNNTWAMIYVGGDNGEAWTLTLENITFDGNNVVPGEDGAILRIEKKGKAVLSQNTILKNGSTNNKWNGGAVCLRNGSPQLTMNPGSQILNCQAGGKSGGGIYMEAGTFTMKGGEITGCTAANGGGVYMTNSSVFNMNGGTITGNIATGIGGGIDLNHTNARINFAGLCTVTGNTLSNGTRCNVQLNQGSTSIINAKGLDARSEIGIYTPSGSIRNNYGVAGKPFGTWSVDEDKLFCFINDDNTTLRGYQGSNTSDKKIYWEYHPLLTVTKTVDSDWVYDKKEAGFSFKVKLTDKTSLTSAERSSITGMGFNQQGEATFILKAGESKTAIFPENFDRISYEVIEVPSEAQTADYTVTAQKDGTVYTFEDDKPLTVAGQLGENIGTDNSTSLSEVTFTNTRVTGELSVSKQVISDVDSDKNTSFTFNVTLDDTSITKTYPATYNYVTESQGVSFIAGKAELTLTDGQTVTIKDLPTDLGYTVEEVLSDAQKANIRTQVSKDESEAVPGTSLTGKIGEKPVTETVEGEDKTIYASKAVFINSFLEIVCKITNRNRELLYYRDAAGNLQPAIYSHLEDAFDQINSGNIRTSSNGNVSGMLRIEMVVPEYAMERTAELNGGKTVLLSTALTSDTQYPYNKGVDDGSGNVSTVIREPEFNKGSMISDSGTLTIDRITLDGRAAAEDSPVTADADGGIVKVAGAVRLTVNSGARLQNSVVTAIDTSGGNGGAIYLSAGASLTMGGTITNCSAAEGGGIYASDGFTIITTTGTMTGCTTASGSGGAIYAGIGTSVNLNAGTSLTNNTAAENGGAVYSGSSVILRGTVGGTGTDEGNTAAANGGGIYMDRGAMFTMYAGSVLSGNEAVYGAGLWAQNTTRIAGGSLEKNIASGDGGAVYATADAAVTISGTALLNENQAAQGGAVYNAGALTMTGGNITGNIASGKGGAVCVEDSGSFTMSGGSITNGNRSPEGAVSAGSGATLTFSGNSVVSGNTGTDGSTAMNVYLGYDSNDIIKTPGLGSNANIGVYVADGEPEDPEVTVNAADAPIYCDHGLPARNFGTYTGTNPNGARLNRFINDRLYRGTDELKGMNGGTKTGPDGGYFVAWEGRGLQLRVTKKETDGSSTYVNGANFTLTNEATNVQVWSGKSSAEGIVNVPWGADEKAGGNIAYFEPGSSYILNETAASGNAVLPAGNWKMTVGRDNSVTWELAGSAEDEKNRTLDIVSPAEAGAKAYLGDTFGLYNDIKPTVTYNAAGGKLANNSQSRTYTVGFTATQTQNTYTITEADPTANSRVFKKWATLAEKPEGEGGEELTPEALEAEGYFEYEKNDSILFYRGKEQDTNVKKKGQANGSIILYAQWDEVVCKITDRSGELLYVNGAPAVYSTLEEGFNTYNDTTAFTYKNGGRATARRIEMLVGEYTLNEELALSRGKTVLFTTAPSTDTDGYAYIGDEGTVCIITRGEGCDTSMITNHSNLTLTNITLDGGAAKEGSTPVTCDGGIVNLDLNSAVLTIGSGATLQNSAVTGNGGAVYVKENATLTLDGGVITGNSANVESGSGDPGEGQGRGGAVYLASGAKMEIRNDERGITAGTINGNSAVAGAGIYLKEGSTLNISGKPDFGGTGMAEDALITVRTDGSGKEIPAGNFVTVRPEEGEGTEGTEEYKNGGLTYPKENDDYYIRQDIYIEGYKEDDGETGAASLVVNGNITSGSGTIWVWAEETPHYKMTEQFAKIAAGTTVNEATLAAFRNAAPDSLTENNADEFLYGIAGEDEQSIYWSGTKGRRKVILRKVNDAYNNLPDAVFTIYKGSSTTPFILKHEDNSTEELKDLRSTANGIIWIGTLPYGTYYMHETTVPDGCKQLGTDGNWYILTVNETGAGYEKTDKTLANSMEPAATR